MTYRLNPSNFERAAWAQAGLNAFTQGQDVAAVLRTYSEAKSGERGMYEEPEAVKNDFVSDSLHALTVRQTPELMQLRIIKIAELDATQFHALVAFLEPDPHRRDTMSFGAIQCWTEEQEEDLLE